MHRHDNAPAQLVNRLLAAFNGCLTRLVGILAVPNPLQHGGRRPANGHIGRVITGTVRDSEQSRAGPHLPRRAIGAHHVGPTPVTASEGMRQLREAQRTVVQSSRLGIPAIIHEECLTGFTTFQATVYPAAIAWAATFDRDLIKEMASAIGRDMAAVGVHQGLSPVLDVVRDYRWGRVEETLGEDPYLVSQLGTAYVQGLEENGIIATLKHFAGYSSSKAARNHAPVSMGPRELADYILPPFEHAIRFGHVRSVMNSYAEIDGVPVAANSGLLTDVLRDTWGFTGTVVSDYGAVAFAHLMHKVAGSLEEAGALALAAGIDVELPKTLCYGEPLMAEIEAGRADQALVDRALRRVLAQKLDLGLLDLDWSPDNLSDIVDLDSPANWAIARRIAESSIILLENRAGVLPLEAPKRIAVIGPCADDPQAFFGCYILPEPRAPAIPRLPGQSRHRSEVAADGAA